MSSENSLSDFFSRLGSTLKSAAKIALLSRRSSVRPVDTGGRPLIVMGNGPSLANTMANHAKALADNPTLAVNFAANAPEFRSLRPDYYVMADPVFFRDLDNANVDRLWKNLATSVDWPMTLLIPVKAELPAELPKCVDVKRFNAVGAEGFRRFEHMAYRSGRAMPRPRNVLIPAIMSAIALGYKTIYLTGADHSWSKTLDVTDENVVVSIQPHFYEDNATERARVASVYKNVRLHEIMYSFHVAFRSYFTIRDYAQSRGVTIYNATPGSFIDAFPRRQLPPDA